jgi:hypothetical protein
VAVYVPILKGKPGEFSAWHHASPAVLDATRPVFEVVPKRGAADDVAKFVSDAIGRAQAGVRRWPAGVVLTFDAGWLDQTVIADGAGPLLTVARALHEAGVRARPVVSLRDQPEVLAEAATAHELHGAGICVRLGSEEEDPDVGTTSQNMPGVLKSVGVDREEVDLVVDLRAVEDARTVQRVRPVVEQVVRWITGDGVWRSVAVVSGAFPASISNLPKDEQTALRRFDADLWVSLSDLPRTPDFGDYGVAHPSMPTNAGFGPLPNLRYTNGEEWWIWRESKAVGNESMRTLCARVVRSTAWPADGAAFSWGDAEVARVSRGEGGTGGAAQWREWGTSHHFAVVTDRLATQNVP